MATVRYFDLVREVKSVYNHRLRLVQSARDRRIKPTARLFATTVPTVRKWLRRYQHGPSGLLEQSRAPHHQPRRTPAYIERQVVALRQILPIFGARRLIREFDLPLSHGALERNWRQHGLLKKRRRKYQRKQNLDRYQSSRELVPANLRGYQGSGRYPSLLAAGAAAGITPHPVHRPRDSQRAAVLVFRSAAQCVR